MQAVALDRRKILVIAYGHLADTMAAVPALRSLRAAYPSASIHVLGLASAQPILGECPYIDRLITWRDFQHKGQKIARAEKLAVVASLGLRLKRSGYDATLLFHRSNGAMRRLAAIVGSPVRAGVSGGGDSFTHPAAADPNPGSSRTENRRVLAAIGVDEDNGPTELWTDALDATRAEELLAGGRRPLVGLHPGSDWSCQQWHPRGFAAVAKELYRRTSAGFVITGSSGEIELQSEIAAGLPEPAVEACGRTSFGQFVEVVRRLDLLICVNSAAAAVARAVGTPAVVLLGLEDARYTEAFHTDVVRVVQPQTSPREGGWCEFGRWGVLSGCSSPMCRGLGGLSTMDAQAVVEPALELLRHRASGTAAQMAGTKPAEAR